ncbi:MAG: hypothetical protein QMD17_07470 [Rhodocyclaceae bacterium]|jgi:hypothetical protein|nr:hypothetical protein [Rhodocyclaceae bacterium]
MHLTLFVPGLLLPDEIRADTVFDLTAPTLSLLLGRGQRHELTPDWLPGAFGLAPPLPAAVLRKVGAGEWFGRPADASPKVGAGGMASAGTAANMGAASGNWICLDPVHLQVAREGISLADPAQLKLTAAEAAALIEVVAPLFADWGTLSASSPSCWELQLNKPVDLTTRPLSDAIGQNVDPALPGGRDGRAWRRLIAAAQTLMHAHPVNRDRDGLGQPTINSLWAWGLGGMDSLPDEVQANFNVVWSRDPVLAGLCAAVRTGGGLPCLAPPERFQPASGRVLAVIDSMEHPARTFDALAWREALLAFERDWLTPAMASLKKRECGELRVIGTRIAGIAGPQRTTAFSLTWNDLWRLWRRPRPLTALT